MEVIQAQSSHSLVQHFTTSSLHRSIFTCAQIDLDAKSLSSCKSFVCLNSSSLLIHLATILDL